MSENKEEKDVIGLRDEFAIALVRGFINEVGMWADEFGDHVYELADKLIEARNK